MIWSSTCFGTANASNDVKRAPGISAAPDRVTVGVEDGRSEVRWDTGDGSMGFVYVSANGGKHTLFAAGPVGSATAPWIKPGRFVFELYREAERQTLLASVTVSGIPATQVSPLTALWQSRATRWPLALLVVALLYFAAYLSAPGAIPKGFPPEPSTSPRQLHVARNLVLGVVVFACIDGVIFHTGLYTSILAPDSFAGKMAILTKAEKERISSGLKEVLVVGDSRIAEGFSVAVADKLGSDAGLKFSTLAEEGSSIDIWYYMLREVDPAARRYSVIVIPYAMAPKHINSLKIAMAAPLLRYTDCFDFAAGFQQWSDRYRAFTACLFRGSAYQADVVDFLEHPALRAKSVRSEQQHILARAAYEGQAADIVGTSYDPNTGQITFPSQLTEAQRRSITYSLTQPAKSEMEYAIKRQRYWIRRILERYSNGPTAIMLMPTPRGPLGGFSRTSMAHNTFFSGIPIEKPILLLPEHTFDFLESPQYYFDGHHLNVRGRQKFTEVLVGELVRRWQSADSTHSASDPE